MPAITVSTINATIGVDDSKLTQGLAAAKANVTRFGSEVAATSSVVSEMMKQAGAAVGTSVSAGSKLASNSLKELSDKFKEVNRSAQEFGESIKEAAEKAGEHVKKLGEDVKKIGKEVSEALDIVILAVGEAVLESGLQVEEGMDAIGRATGKTGEELEGMKGTFKETFGEVSQGAAVVGQTMGLLSSRTGLTGHALAQLTKQMLDLARMQGTDVVATSVAMTREMGDASIAAKDQGQAMDYLFRVSQLTGTTAQSLAEKMTFYGAPLRQMGIGFEQAALLMGKWEKEGVNTELVMGSMRIGLMRLAESGIKEPAKALPLLIEKMKEAKTTGEATAIAMHVFGARAGADMAAAVREGRFNIDELTKAMKATKGGIEATSEATKPLTERLLEFKHKVMDLLEPIGTQLLGHLTKLYEKFSGPLLNAVKEAVDWWTRLKPTTQALIGVFVLVAAAIGPVTFAVGAMIIAIGAILPVAGAVVAFFVGPWGIAFAGAAYAIYEMVFKGAHSLNQLKNNIMELWAWLKPTWASLWNNARDTVVGVWQALEDIIGGAVQVIVHIVTAIVDFFNGDWKGAWDEAGLAVKAAWDHIVDLIMNAAPRIWNAIKGLWKGVMDALSGGSTEAQAALSTQVHKDSVAGISDGLDKAAKSEQLKQKVRALYDQLPKYQKNANDWAKYAVQHPNDQTAVNGLQQAIDHLNTLKGAIKSARTELAGMSKDGNKAADAVNKFAANVKSQIGGTAGGLSKADMGKLDKLEETGKHGGGTKAHKLSEAEKEARALKVALAAAAQQYTELGNTGDSSLAKLMKHYHAIAASHRSEIVALDKINEKIKARMQTEKDSTAVFAEAAKERGKARDLEFALKNGRGKDEGQQFLAAHPNASKEAVAAFQAAHKQKEEDTEATRLQKEATAAYDASVKKLRTSIADEGAELLKLTHTRTVDQIALRDTGMLYDQLTDKKRRDLVLSAAVQQDQINWVKEQETENKQAEKSYNEVARAIAGMNLKLSEKSETPEQAGKREVTPFLKLTDKQQDVEREDASVKLLGADYAELDDIMQSMIDAYLVAQHAVAAKTAADAAEHQQQVASQHLTEELTKHLVEVNAQLNHVDAGSKKHSQFVNETIAQAAHLTKEQLDLLNQLIAAENKLSKDQSHAQKVKQLMDTMRQSFDQMFMGIITGSKNAFAQLVTGFETMLQQMAAKYLASQVVNGFFKLLGFNPDGTMTGGGLFGGGGSASSDPGSITGIPGMASGGTVMGGKTYLVGENGPELFRAPQGGGKIVPNEQLGGGVTIHLNVQAADVHSFRQYSQGQAAADLAQAIQIAQRRNG